MRHAVRRPALVLVAVLAVAVSSCSASDEAGEAGEAADAPSTPATAAPSASPAAPTQTESAAAAKGAAGHEEPEVQVAAADLADFSCSQRASGAWTARGDITNSTSEPMVYTLTVVTVQGADDVAGEQEKQFVLAPEESTSFDLARFAHGSADTCMPRLLRAPR